MKIINILYIVIILAISIYLQLIYISYKEYSEKKTNPLFKPETYNIKGKFTYDSIPLNSENPIDNIYLSLVFPAYNENERLEIPLKETIKYLNTLKISYEIIIVNDGSKDNTFEIINKIIKENPNNKIIGVTYSKNGGKGYAVKTGMQYIRGKYALMLDSDGATDIRDYEKLLKEIKGKEKSIAIGSRKINLENVERVWYRDIMGRINNIIVQNIIGIKGIKDTQCGFKLFSRSAARIIFKNMHIVRWAFDVDLLYICNKSNISVKEVPVTCKDVPGSKLVVITATISFFRDYFAMITFYNIGIWKVDLREEFINGNI